MRPLFIPMVCLMLLGGCSNSPQDPPVDNDNLNNNDNGPGQEDPGFPCDFDAECNDGVACNGPERCIDNLCEPGTPPCAEGLFCEEATRRCLECLQDADCDDELFCNGAESCDVAGGRCRTGVSPCSTGQSCNEAAQSCGACADDADCDDGESCTVDTCEEGSCRNEPASDCCERDSDCADADPCTIDSCAGGECRNVPMDCDDDVFCNGSERCVDGACVAGTSPCATTQTCNEADNTCSGSAPQGVCCVSGVACQVLTQAACTSQSGAYSGDGTTCTPNSCVGQPTETGACCQANGSCQVLTASACSGQSGTYGGNGTSCSPNPCSQPTQTGACCQASGDCSVTTSSACTSGGGTCQGNSSTCASAQCQAPISCPAGAVGDCCAPHETTGCQVSDCCSDVCDSDAFCCDTAWDVLCAVGAQQLCGSLCPAPVNDACTAASAILDGDTSFSTIGATTDGPENPLNMCNDDGENQTHHDIWYDYVASCSGNLTVSTCGQVDYDSDLVVYNGCNCPATTANLLGCNDDFDDCTEDAFASELKVPVVQGNCYKIRIGGFSDSIVDSGTGIVTVSCQPN